MTRTSTQILEGFAGPGGWSQGLRDAGHIGTAIGIEHDGDACATATAAGHTRVQADVAATDPCQFGPVDGLVMSPPCQAWSMAGKRGGERDRDAVFARMTAFARGRRPAEHQWADARSALTAEPMRYAHALRPRWIALEQVPPVLTLWQHAASLLRELGYRAWCGVLAAERYGVPQTRRRAILIARRDAAPATPPEPTHQEYRSGREFGSDVDLFGSLLPPPVSMADALGWGLAERPAWTVTAGGTDTGGAEVFGNFRNRQQLAALADRQADVVLRSNYTDGGDLATRTTRTPDEPATTITSKVGHWVMRNGSQDNACVRGIDEPAGTIFFGRAANAVEFLEYDGQGRRRVSVAEAGVLQGFPVDYPWRGTKSAQYRQVGDAVPPPLAAAILAPLLAHAANPAHAAA
ncbi:DNA cytosine methyltransferase [Amycolatopsis benzoatilytica]|uniref:DNA cytosine methyltransferase n=1 Tax=Amycolatopsis benzoatilytica TaxID=346045 RepID=UPI0003739208|nr:DNA cytosine methyltransferase [Amycolatopsis benzoatilytica]